MRELVDVLDRLATSRAPVLISGSPGSGKAQVARALHARSPAHAGPLEVQVAAELKSSDLLAAAERCVGGALVIRGIEHLDDDSQRTLLGVLDRVRTRIIATTSVRLEDMAKEGLFRAELLYRIQVLSIRVPALKERPQDLPLLWAEACENAAREAGRPTPTTTDDAWALLRRCAWSGNVLELKNAARHAVLCAGTSIAAADLPPQVQLEPVPTDEIRLPGMRLRDLERIAILRTYEATGSAKATAEMLDISVRKVHYRLKEYREAEEGHVPPPVEDSGRHQIGA